MSGKPQASADIILLYPQVVAPCRFAVDDEGKFLRLLGIGHRGTKSAVVAGINPVLPS